MKTIVIAFFAMLGAAFGEDYYIEFTHGNSITTKDGIVLQIWSGDCFPLVVTADGTPAFRIGQMTAPVPARGFRKVFNDDTAQTREQSAIVRISAEYDAKFNERRAADMAKARSDKEFAARMADPNSEYNQLLRAAKEERDRANQQAQNGAAWLKQRALESELNHLRAEKIMRQQNGQQ
jgi:hypothetical protein